MRYREALPGLLILVLRLFFLPPLRWPTDWIAVLSLMWIAVAMTREDSRVRRWAVGLTCSWLFVIYAVHQGSWTFAAWK